MGAGNRRQRGGGVQSKVKRFEIRLGVAYCFMFLIPVYLWIGECLALPFMVSLTQVTVIAALLIFKVQKIFLEKIEIEKSCNLSFNHQEAIEFLLNRWYEFSSPSIEQMVRTRLRDLKLKCLSSLELKSFSLGEEAPKLRIVRVCPVEHDNHENSIQLDSDQMAIQFVAHVTFPKFSLEAVIWLINFIPYTVNMKEVQISGNIKITVVLSRTLPFPNIVSATFSLTEKPDVTSTEDTVINPCILNRIYTALVEPASLQIYGA